MTLNIRSQWAAVRMLSHKDNTGQVTKSCREEETGFWKFCATDVLGIMLVGKAVLIQVKSETVLSYVAKNGKHIIVVVIGARIAFVKLTGVALTLSC
mmetsp:Transcript_24239/g.34751  ORF Transcript_24239/g.34751 Transcript_24239/m.34751 type:complete len:97 (+) Transcript_24239:42-332(+)